jgi:hypothetical protein
MSCRVCDEYQFLEWKCLEMSEKRGRKPGGPKTGGRKAGTPNKATREIKELAMQFVPSAIQQLGAMSVSAESEAVRLGAIKEIFDRAFGKAPQAMVHSGAVATCDLTRATDEELDTMIAILSRLEAPAIS